MPPDDRPGTAHDEGLTGADAEGVPDFRAARRHVLLELVRLVAKLRRDGVDVPATGSLDAARALAVVGLGDKARVEAALQAALISGATDRGAFSEAFPTFWHRLQSGLDRVATAHDGPTAGDDDDAEDDGDDSERPGDDATAEDSGLLENATPPETDGREGDKSVEVRIPTERQHATGDRPAATGDGDARRYSAVAGGERVDASPARLDDAAVAAIDRFVDALATLPGRRRRTGDAGDRVDARRTLRASLSTGGAPVDLPRSAPTPTALRCCLLVDVSGSVLDTVDRRVLLAFAHRLVESARDSRVFLFDTDLVDATPQFARADGDPAAALRDAEIEWGGGTQIGASFTTLRDRHPSAVDRRTVVVVVSDGLDVGDPETLADGITWLSDRAAALVWLNPLAVSASFEPQARGMATSEPYVDALFGFAEPADLAEAARQIEHRGLDGRLGYEYDRRAGDVS